MHPAAVILPKVVIVVNCYCVVNPITFIELRDYVSAQNALITRTALAQRQRYRGKLTVDRHGCQPPVTDHRSPTDSPPRRKTHLSVSSP